MKKIGILTFHTSINNGAVMQAYSLVTRLAKEYPDYQIEIIDYRMNKIDVSYRLNMIQYIKHKNSMVMLKKFLQLISDPFKLRRRNQRAEIFERFIQRLPLSQFTIIEDSSEKLFERINQEYDVIIVGSDAVWNYVVRGFPNAYFPDERVRCTKLSYAASCYGMDFTEEDVNRKRIGEILSGFSFIGVRDKATEEFVEWSGCNIMAEHTCDPTAFLDLQQLPIDEKEIKEKLRCRGFDFEKPSIGMMGNDKMCKMIKSMYNSQYQIVALYEYVKGADVNLYDLDPFEWAFVFKYFKLTFTTFFHGTMLSLRNGVPLICIALDTPFAKKHVPKTLDLLERLGYQNWYFQTDYKGENFRQIKEQADFLLTNNFREEIVAKIDSEAESFSALKKALDYVLLS